ncbi:TPA: hydrogenase maturation nickel metallochaperone HypA [bacterium]|jgi:hydrogenase nickel incorporation protein HypA/HybF|nr:hydrogenase maturation nickel metallochaperone HypA [bacterium]
MHEIAIVESIIDIVSAEMKKHNMTKLETIKLRIGEMSNIMLDALVFSFDVLSKETPLEGAKLIIETVLIKFRCKDCKIEFTIKDTFGICPECNGINCEIISGKELEIAELNGS